MNPTYMVLLCTARQFPISVLLEVSIREDNSIPAEINMWT